MVSQVFEICVAYEQGVGDGWEHERKGRDNPYAPGELREAWDYGFEEGLKQLKISKTEGDHV